MGCYHDTTTDVSHSSLVRFDTLPTPDAPPVGAPKIVVCVRTGKHNLSELHHVVDLGHGSTKTIRVVTHLSTTLKLMTSKFSST
jgi:hypothetical protein